MWTDTVGESCERESCLVQRYPIQLSKVSNPAVNWYECIEAATRGARQKRKAQFKAQKIRTFDEIWSMLRIQRIYACGLAYVARRPDLLVIRL